MATRKPTIEKELLTPEQAMRVLKPIVYALCDKAGKPFYIGKTKNPSQRFMRYMRPERCHSQLIAEKIDAANGFMVRVLDFDPLDLSAAEVQRIKEFDGLTVNVVGRGMRFPDLYGAKPWSLGAGAITPSSFLMTNLQMSVYSPELSKQLRKKIKKMDDLRRCVFELDVFRDMNPLAQKMLIPWFKATAPKMVAYMEAQHAKI